MVFSWLALLVKRLNDQKKRIVTKPKFMFWLLIAKGKNYRRDEDYQFEHKLESLNFMRKTG